MFVLIRARRCCIRCISCASPRSTCDTAPTRQSTMPVLQPGDASKRPGCYDISPKGLNSSLHCFSGVCVNQPTYVRPPHEWNMYMNAASVQHTHASTGTLPFNLHMHTSFSCYAFVNSDHVVITYARSVVASYQYNCLLHPPCSAPASFVGKGFGSHLCLPSVVLRRASL